MSYSFLKPVRIGNMVLKNRVIVPAMARYLCKDGYVTDAYVEYLRAIAEGGVAMVTVGIMPIDLNWPSTMPTQPCLGDDKYIPGLTRAVAAIHAGGAKASLQPWMPGRAPYTYANAVERAQDIAIVNRLTVDEIHNIQKKYAAAALRCAMAGADVVEWHNAHNYLGEQFFSPYFNHRTDEYGQQSVENSMRFAREALTLTRRTLDAAGYSHVELIAKLNGSEIINDDITPELLAASAKELEKAGIALITVNGGGGLTRLEGMSGDGHRPEGWKVKYAEIVKNAVSIPVAASGNLKHPSYVDAIIREGKCDLVALGRTSICDPHWVNKCKAGREDLIRYCLSCMHCVYALPADVCGCTMNPRCRREAFTPRVEDTPQTGAGRKVVVVGAGPAGCLAAITLAQRGFRPILCDKNDFLGGMMVPAGMPIGKQEFQNGINYYANMLRELKVDVRLNTEVDAAFAERIAPDAVIVAVGSAPIPMPLPVEEGARVLSIDDLYLEGEQPGDEVVVLGGGLTGCECAINQVRLGRRAHIVEMRDGLAIDANIRHRPILLAEVERAGIDVNLNARGVRVERGGLAVADGEGKEHLVPGDTVICAIGQRSRSDAADALRDAAPFVRVVGDAVRPSNITTAVYEAYHAAFDI